jgi:cephalosporin-C deacetylase-like acetyl esterase
MSAILAAGALAANVGGGQIVRIVPDHADGQYQAGETAKWIVQVSGQTTTQLEYGILKNGQVQFASGSAAVSNRRAEVAAALAEPGSLLLNVRVPDSRSATASENCGAVFSPEKIEPVTTRPDDFDAFWQAKLEELAAVPVNPQLKEGASGSSFLEYWYVTLDNIRGARVQGQLARPKRGKKFPALLLLQAAGVNALEKEHVISLAGEGWLALHINAHDLPIDSPPSFYKEQNDGPLKHYPFIGSTNRESSYFLRMYLSCVRAAEYLAGRPDWDGRTLVASGGSQGGMQAIVVAGLSTNVTAVMARVPAGCDMFGFEAERKVGWPINIIRAKAGGDTNVFNTIRYFDAANFAPRVKCPVLIGVGLVDPTCPPTGVYAVFNRLAGPKEIVPLVRGAHGDKGGTHAPYFDRGAKWQAAMRAGKPLPPR